MNHKIILVVFVALLALSTSYAANQKSGAVAAQSSKITGVIDKIDLNTKTISFRPDDSKQSQEISFNESTLFQKDNAAIKVEDLKQGDRVAIEVDSTNTITRLESQPAGTDQAQQQQ